MAGKNDPSTKEPIGKVKDEDGLMELFNQFPSLTSNKLGWLEPDTAIVISEASLQGKSAMYQVTIQNLITTALLDKGEKYQLFQKSSLNYYLKHLKC